MVLINKYYAGVRRREPADPNPIYIYWATDAHVYAEVDGNPEHENAKLGDRYFYTVGQKLQNFVDDINTYKPDLVFFTGDMVEAWGLTGSPELFLIKWNQIEVRKELIIGNHDMAIGGADIANTTMADMLGYGNNPIIAGSKYNYSFYLDNGFNKVKIISFDTNLDENGNHAAIAKQTVTQPVIDWIESELLNSQTNSVIMFSHANPGDDTEWHFQESGQLAFKQMIDNVAAQRPNLKMYCLAGHNHRQGINEYTRLGPNIRCFSISPIVDFEIGKYAIVSISQKYGLSIREVSLHYPYP